MLRVIKRHIITILLVFFLLDILMFIDFFAHDLFTDRYFFLFILLVIIWSGQFLVGIIGLPMLLKYFTQEERKARYACIVFIFYNFAYYGLMISIGSGDLELPWKH